MATTPAIYAAMAKVFEGLKNVPKNGKMSHQGGSYSYLRADDVQEALNPLLVEHGVIVSSTYTSREVTRPAVDKTLPYVNVDLELVYHSVEDGSTFPPEGALRATGEAKGTDDKSINKALTQAIKNLHRTTFQFASGEPDSDDATAGGNEGQRVPTKSENTVAKARAKAAPAAKSNPKIEELKTIVRTEFLENKDSTWSREEITAKWGEIAVSLSKDKATVEVYTALIEALRAK